MKKVLAKMQAIENDRSRGIYDIGHVDCSYQVTTSGIFFISSLGFGGKIEWVSFNDSAQLAKEV